PYLAMLSRKYRALLLDHSLHTSFFQVLADSIWVERPFRMLSGTKSRDGRDMETSGRGNGVSRMARIKHGENGILLGR
ncbi:hypothetical protein PAXRUDRAFT_156349, partial [Paxillus rubicundulus Ve08.2h10]